VVVAVGVAGVVHAKSEAAFTTTRTDVGIVRVLLLSDDWFRVRGCRMVGDIDTDARQPCDLFLKLRGHAVHSLSLLDVQ